MNPQQQLLRAQVERTLAAPAVIMVTSALQRDGKSLTAHSLAVCLARSGHKTALVDLTHAVGENVTQLTGGSEQATHHDVPAPVSLTPGLRSSRGAMKAFVDESRAAYDYTILDSAALLSDDIAMGLAGAVDGLLLTVRLGRAPSELDGLTMRLIERSEGRVIGVVATEPEAIEGFARRQFGEPVLETERTRGAAKPRVSWVHPVRETALAFVAATILTWGSSFALAASQQPGFWSSVRAAVHWTIQPAEAVSTRLASRIGH